MSSIKEIGKNPNEIQLIKTKWTNNPKSRIIHTPPSEESHAVIHPLEKTEEQTETSLSLHNINKIIINKIW